MLHVVPIVFVADDDNSVRKSLELLIGGEACRPTRSLPRTNSLTTNEFPPRAVSFLMFLFEAR